MGWDISTGPLDVIAGIGLMILIGYTFSWVFAWVGLNSSTPETANAFGFILIFPLTFASSAFAPPQEMPEPLQTFAEDINPFSAMVDAARRFFLGTPAGNDVWASIAWCIGIVLVFGDLSVRRYRQAVSSNAGASGRHCRARRPNPRRPRPQPRPPLGRIALPAHARSSAIASSTGLALA